MPQYRRSNANQWHAERVQQVVTERFVVGKNYNADQSRNQS
jgi:hypothetical protein